MANERRVPPSGRDFVAYERVMVEQFSTREVALELRVSQTRVCQVVKRVGEYVLEVAPACNSDEDRGRQLYVAQQIAAEQVRFFIREAHEGFQRSIGQQTVVRTVETENKPKKTISTTKMSHGDPRFLDRAVKYALLGAKLATPNLASLLPDEDEAVLEEADRVAVREMEDDEAEVAAEAKLMEEWAADERAAAEGTNSQVPEDSRLQLRSKASPPDEDCSRGKAEQGVRATESKIVDDAKSGKNGTSDVFPNENEATLRAEPGILRPVHLRQLLLKMGLQEDEMDAFLSTAKGQIVQREYEALVRRFDFPAHSQPHLAAERAEMPVLREDRAAQGLEAGSVGPVCRTGP